MLKKYSKGNLIALSVACALGATNSMSAADKILQKAAAPTSLKTIDKSERLSFDDSKLVEVFIEHNDEARGPRLRNSIQTADQKMGSLRNMMQKFPGKEMSAQSSKAGVAWKMKATDVESLKKMPEVKRVSFIVPSKPLLRNSVSWIGAPSVWDSVGNGDNNGNADPVTISIIDSGTDYYHAGLGGAGNPEDFINNDPSIIEPGTFPTAKVIAGIDFAGADNQAFATDPDPVGVGSFHGSHVSGIAAGTGTDQVSPGVAPGANLYAVKVFADNGGGTTLSHIGIQWSEDPNQDGDDSDRADVMNLSLGSDYGDPDSIGAVAADTASENGSIMVLAAGNGGNIPYIHGGPAISAQSISVASSIAGGVVAGINASSDNPDANGSFLAVEGSHSNTFANGGLISGSLVAVDGLDGCAPLTNADDVSGNVALVIRGACGFNDKYTNALAAGATGIVVFNDGTDPSRVNPIVMGGIDPALPLTGVMVSSTTGFSFLNALSNGQSVNVFMDNSTTTNTDPSVDGSLSGFTSRGPGLDNSFKPDVAAPGEAIASVSLGTGNGTGTISGTSMASPHVAGVAALLKQQWPDLPPSAIKAILQNSSTPAYRDGVAGSSDPYPLTLQGVGRVQVDVASTLTSYAAPGGVSFGRVNAKYGTHLSREVTVKNMSADTKIFAITHEPGQTISGVNVRTYQQQVYLAPYSSRTISLAMDFNPNDAPFDSFGNSQSEVDGWFVFNDILSDETLRVGYMAAVDPASGVNAYRSYNSIGFYNNGSSDSYAEGFTLANLANSEGQESHDIEALGYRTGVNLFGGAAIDFAFVTKGAWSSLSPLAVILNIDSDEDGIEETTLQIADTNPDPNINFDGIVDKIIFPGGYNLGSADYDFNDRVMITRYLIDRNALAPDAGFLDAGDTNFNYTLSIFNRFTGETSELSGSIDLNDEINVESNSFVMPKNGSFNSQLTSDTDGEMLWLYQQNQAQDQAQVIRVQSKNNRRN